MNRVIGITLAMLFVFAQASIAGAQAGAHASVGLGHGEEGYLHLQEMVKHLEFSLKMSDASPDMKKHLQAAINGGKDALKTYDEALKHASEALGRPAGGGKGPMSEGSEHEREREGSGSHKHDEGSR
jgi:hypothetical protein